ncbi:tyrosine-type recombinase/integrase [Planctomicrobium sp. SH668]|uniref:tyrosine-type recombinase/integrase n=1 Tax=Planctomicrobium sp. SH668 TaxID=3448126 RepID=UPI003F5AE1E1
MAASGVRDRQRFIRRDEFFQLMDACPNHHWRTIVALCRYGGLRCPTEVLSLRLDDINWETGRMSVSAPKMERHSEKAVRTVPLFPELKPFLEESFELATDGAVYVVDERFRKAAQGPNGWLNANLRTTFLKIIKRAGLVPWPRPFQNLRSSRETELVEQFPIQVVTDWLGNSPKIAMKHYLQTTDAHFEKATQNPTTHIAETSRTDSQLPMPSKAKTPVVPGFATNCEILRIRKVAVEGFEPPTRGL